VLIVREESQSNCIEFRRAKGSALHGL
jgi:hypothetical protein